MGWSAVQPFDRSDQAIAALGNGLEIARRLAVIAERLAQLADGLGQHIVGGQGVRPHPFEQRLAAHHLAVLAGQRQQHMQGFDREPGRFVSVGRHHFPARHIDHEFADTQAVGFLVNRLGAGIEHSGQRSSWVPCKREEATCSVISPSKIGKTHVGNRNNVVAKDWHRVRSLEISFRAARPPSLGLRIAHPSCAFGRNFFGLRTSLQRCQGPSIASSALPVMCHSY